MNIDVNNAQELAEALKRDPVIAITNDFKLIKLNIEWSEATDRPTVLNTDIDYIMVMTLSNIMNFYSGIAEYLKDNPNLTIIN